MSDQGRLVDATLWTEALTAWVLTLTCPPMHSISLWTQVLVTFMESGGIMIRIELFGGNLVQGRSIFWGFLYVL